MADSSGTTTYTWNARDQLVGLSGLGVTASFTYDAVGRRQSKTVNGVTTHFLYDGLNVVQELTGGTPTANLLTGLGIDETLLRTDATGPRSFLTDGVGSTLALTDSAGLIQSEYTYEPFGKTTATGTASTNAFTYTGREDDGTGLYYYRARYYHPGLQHFLSEDPIGFNGRDVNLYGYVGNDPVDWVDPMGQNAMSGAIPAGGAAGTAVCGPPCGVAVAGLIAGVIVGQCIWDYVLHNKGSDNAPRGSLPRAEGTGNYLPDPAAEGSHSTFGPRQGSDGQPYQQGATFGGNGEFQGRTDVTNHGRGDHANPHFHPAAGPNSVQPGNGVPIP